MTPLSYLLTLALISCTLPLDLRIVNSPDHSPHPAPCALICSGQDEVPGWVDSKWLPGKVNKYIDIYDCGFVSTPVITVTSSGVLGACPSLFTVVRGSDDFDVFSVEDATAEEVTRKMCYVHWTAIGYNC